MSLDETWKENFVNSNLHEIKKSLSEVLQRSVSFPSQRLCFICAKTF